MKWVIQGKILKNQNLSNKHLQSKILEIILANRGVTEIKEIENFLNPVNPSRFLFSDLGIEEKEVFKAVTRIKEAVDQNESIIIYGDYDVDGICSTAMLWECLYEKTKNVLPFIPLRSKEGYGLSIAGINTILEDKKYGISEGVKSGLIISVDSGIVANEAVKFAKEHGLDVIILDHHQAPNNLPEAFAIIHSVQLCAAGITFLFVDYLTKELGIINRGDEWLELAAMATIADLVPLIGSNRSIAKYGLDALNKTSRVGLKALFEMAGIKKIGTYEVGYLIGPVLNASGRIDSAILGLRLLCSKDITKASEYARELIEINKQRQLMLEEMIAHAIMTSESRVQTSDKIIVLEHESYHEGVIGLVAGRLVEKYYLPAIIIAKGEKTCKASARSIRGFNIIEAIRECDSLLLGAGGHPMAAGFSVATEKISDFKVKISNLAKAKISDDMATKVLRVDCEVSLADLDVFELYKSICSLEPFGMNNSEPVFVSEVVALSVHVVGQGGKHLKLSVMPSDCVTESAQNLDAIAFGKGEMFKDIKKGSLIKIAYSLSLDEYNGKNKIQLKIKDILIES